MSQYCDIKTPNLILDYSTRSTVSKKRDNSPPVLCADPCQVWFPLMGKRLSDAHWKHHLPIRSKDKQLKNA